MAEVGCILQMAGSVNSHGVDATGYEKFVDYTINTLNPANSEIGATYASTVAETTSSVNLFSLLIVFFAFFILSVLLFHLGLISEITLISVLALAAIIILIFYMLTVSYATSLAIDVVPTFQQSLATSFLLTANSAVRNIIYLTVCE